MTVRLCFPRPPGVGSVMPEEILTNVHLPRRESCGLVRLGNGSLCSSRPSRPGALVLVFAPNESRHMLCFKLEQTYGLCLSRSAKSSNDSKQDSASLNPATSIRFDDSLWAWSQKLTSREVQTRMGQTLGRPILSFKSWFLLKF